MAAERKAVKANLEDLINDGSYNIEYSTKVRFYPEPSYEIEKAKFSQGFYCNSVFTDSELRLLKQQMLEHRTVSLVSFPVRLRVHQT